MDFADRNWMLNFQNQAMQTSNLNPASSKEPYESASTTQPIQFFPAAHANFHDTRLTHEWTISDQGQLSQPSELGHIAFMNQHSTNTLFMNNAPQRLDSTWLWEDRDIGELTWFEASFQPCDNPVVLTQQGVVCGSDLSVTINKLPSVPQNLLIAKVNNISVNTKFEQSLQKILVGVESSGRDFNQSQYQCPWRRCGLKEGFVSRSTLESHVEDIHVRAIERAGPGCKWPDCNSKGIFKTEKALVEHVQNIHICPLLCQEQCGHKKPFGKQGDLERHIQSKHRQGNMSHMCPRPLCSTAVRSFARRDKLREHLRNWHGPFECLSRGCPRGSGNGFKNEVRLATHTRNAHTECAFKHCETSNTHSSREKGLLEEHLRALHGDYECEIGKCSEGHASAFILYTLRKHLIKDHSIGNEQAVLIVDSLAKAGECTLKEAQLMRLGWTRGQRTLGPVPKGKIFLECLSCSFVDEEDETTR